MLTENQVKKHFKERRSESHKLIKDMIETRTKLLALYSQLGGNKPFNENLDGDLNEILEEFCEVLIDYTSQAHFRLYHYIDTNTEKRKAILELAEKIYPKILQSTQTIVDFNDRYSQDASADENGNTVIAIPTDKLESDLSHLGEQMAERIELEDQLIKIMVTGRTETAVS